MSSGPPDVQSTRRTTGPPQAASLTYSGVVFLFGLTLNAGSFDTDVRPVISNTCIGCHNAQLASGNLNLTPFLQGSSLSNREAWEAIVAKLRAGEMPPKGVPRPPAEKMEALLHFVQQEFDRADASAPRDPGRVTAHRLNRAEYANTIRDLLGVDFRADEEFPADDSGYGFDNIGDVLTVAPTLMAKYLSAAEKIAARAVGGDPLPRPGVFSRKDHIRRIDVGRIQLEEIVENDADYSVRVNLTGHRGANDKPVTLEIRVDGKTVKAVNVPMQISAVNQQGGATQRSTEEVKVFLRDGRHVIDAEFVNDEGLAAIPEEARRNTNRNIFPDSIEIAGPYAPVARASSPALPDLSVLARRAYRRPASKAEVAELRQVEARARAAGYTPAQSLQFAIAAMLVSPNFLFRIEHDPKPGAPAPVSDIELASRLSYFLWSSMPDDELMHLAEANKLRAALDAQVRRMVADRKFAAFAENFAGQWLEVRSLDAVKRDAKKFPEWNVELKEAMETETRLFFESLVREDRPISELIDGRYTFLNQRLAKHYGIADVTGPEFRRVELTAEQAAQRSGVFTQGSVLTVSSYPTRTSVVLRGHYLLDNILNAAPPPPPPGIPLLNEEATGVEMTQRQLLERHRSDPACGACHSRMDVLGFSLENYDATGKWRTQDGKFPVDASGAFPDGRAFAGPAEMKALLKQNMPEFARCLTEKMLTYSLGRGVEKFDRLAVQDLVRQTAAHEYKIQSLMLAIVHSAPFQQRRAEAPK